MTSGPRLVLLTGPPGTGKSTLATVAASAIGSPVLGWDWAMAALTGFAEVQGILDAMERERYRAVGWALLTSLATAQLRDGRPVVLDGVARDVEVAVCRQVATAAGAPATVVVTRCSDRALHRTRIEGRDRAIPGWHELRWDDVARGLDRWTEPTGADLVLDAADPRPDNEARLRQLLGEALT